MPILVNHNIHIHICSSNNNNNNLIDISVLYTWHRHHILCREEDGNNTVASWHSASSYSTQTPVVSHLHQSTQIPKHNQSNYSIITNTQCQHQHTHTHTLYTPTQSHIHLNETSSYPSLNKHITPFESHYTRLISQSNRHSVTQSASFNTTSDTNLLHSKLPIVITTAASN